MELRHQSSQTNPIIRAIIAARLLRELDLSGSDVSDQGVKALVASAVNLKTLDLSNCSRLTSATLASLADHKHLEELRLWWTKDMRDSELSHFAKLKSLRSLTLRADWLVLHPEDKKKALVGRGLEHLKGLPNLRRLVFFSLLTDSAFPVLKEMKQLGELRILGYGEFGSTENLKSLLDALPETQING